MELHQTNLTDPVAFIARDLATTFYARITEGQKPPQYGGMFDKGLFQKFLDQFNCITITSGLPKNDYGQTVQLSHVENPKLEEMEEREIPPHLISEGLSLKPTEMTGRYGYRKAEDNRGNTLAVEEFFFFEFQTGYSPETFSKLSSSLAALRYLSSTMHTLDSFKVMLCEAGVYVSLRARIGDSYKPAFAMNS